MYFSKKPQIFSKDISICHTLHQKQFDPIDRFVWRNTWWPEQSLFSQRSKKVGKQTKNKKIYLFLFVFLPLATSKFGHSLGLSSRPNGLSFFYWRSIPTSSLLFLLLLYILWWEREEQLMITLLVYFVVVATMKDRKARWTNYFFFIQNIDALNFIKFINSLNATEILFKKTRCPKSVGPGLHAQKKDDHLDIECLLHVDQSSSRPLIYFLPNN